MNKKVLLCGTKYGQTYLPAIFQEKGFELVAIVAKGSHRSVRLAEQYDVPLYTSLEHIKESIDIACIAVNEKVSVSLGQHFLQQGTSILIEHPIGITTIQKLQTDAEQNNCCCHINSHFAELAPVADFIQLGKKLNHSSQAHIINISCNSRTLFSTIDILMRIFGCFKLSELTITRLKNYCQASFYINETPITLIYQQWRYEQDDSMDSPLGHQFTITYPQGVLQLTGTFGPCLWFPLLAGGIPAMFPISQTYQAEPGVSGNNVESMYRWRKNANQKVLREMFDEFRNLAPQHSREYQMNLCDTWSELFEKFSTTYQKAPTTTLFANYWTPEKILEEVKVFK